MSDFGEEIIDRLDENSTLRQLGNPARKLILNTVGEWLDRYADDDYNSQLFITEATGRYLDVIGNDYAILRNENETDEHYRKKIIYNRLGHLTIKYLLEIYDLELFVYVENFNPSENDLTSDNYYITFPNGLMCSADNMTKEALSKKFVIGGDLKWL